LRLSWLTEPTGTASHGQLRRLLSVLVDPRHIDTRSFAFTNSELVVSTQRAIRTWEDFHRGWEARWLAHPDAIRSWTFRPEGRWLAMVTGNGVLHVFDGVRG